MDPSTLHRSPEPTAYEHEKYGAILDWRRGCILINGRSIVLISAEFHYFRVPDRSRWRQLLISLRGVGFNCVRLYFHWGYHSPTEGQYDFSGPRDIDYLLTLCEELHLFVIAAPGPYICAETQAGGYPTWIIAKKHLRIRHLSYAPLGMIKFWDEEFHQYCAQYLRKLLAILVPHERPRNPQGCIISMQIENELHEMVPGSIGGLNDEIRRLAETVRGCGSTVPLFHNDDFPSGSWASGKPRRKIRHLMMALGAPMSRTDLYGTDIYFTFPRGDRSGDASSCQVGMIELGGIAACLQCCGIGGTGIGGADLRCLAPLFDTETKKAPPTPNGWMPKQMMGAVDVLEKKFQKIGGSAAHGPPIIAEGQVGWINQWARLRDYDDIYNFFGDQFSSTFLTSLAAQGVTCSNHYMGYGGTNYGCSGDTEVYTSYDYSAFIREYGKLSSRGRRFRQTALFLRSFAEMGLAETLRVEKKDPHVRIKATLPNILIAVRRCEKPVKNQTFLSFCFLRNFAGANGRFNLIVDNVVAPCWLSFKDSLVLPVYYRLRRGFSVLVTTIPILTRARYAGAELWVLKVRESEKGRLIIKADELKITNQSSSAKRKLLIKWASLSTINEASFPGSIVLSEDSEGAASSFLSAPLEEVPLGEWEDLPAGSPSVCARVSTEEAGLCFTIRMSGTHLPCVVSVSSLVSDGEGGESDEVILRLLAIGETDADTYTADLSFAECFSTSSTGRSFAKPAFCAAWGASELSFLPDNTLIAVSLPDRERVVFVVSDSKVVTHDSGKKTCATVDDLIPGIYVYELPTGPLHSVGGILDKQYVLEHGNWERHVVDWSRDAVWLSIRYEERCPLNFHMTSGHVAYRVRFKTQTTDLDVKINVRHVGTIWCNGIAVGGQICYSHNALSAGAMHACDIKWAGKKRYSLRKGLANGPGPDGFHNLIILTQSFGQSRSPFLLNDVRNKRGLLSCHFSRKRKITDIDWAICGVPVSSIPDPFNTSGLPFEGRANEASNSNGFSQVANTNIIADDGVVYYRTTFKTRLDCAIGGRIRYPLRAKVVSSKGAVAMIWINGLLVGRYVEQAGPQSNFYIPEGLIELKDNLLVVAAYGSTDTSLDVQLLPWVVDSNSGNLNESIGDVFAADITTIKLSDLK